MSTNATKGKAQRLIGSDVILHTVAGYIVVGGLIKVTDDYVVVTDGMRDRKLYLAMIDNVQAA